MPKASEMPPTEYVKAMMIGHSGAGKTGALTSLVQAGYKLRIIDLDNGLASLIHHVREADPKLLDKIEYQSFHDPVKVAAGGTNVKGGPKAFVKAVQALDTWEDGSACGELGPEYVVVLDSLTGLGRAAFEWAKASNPSAREPRQHYFAAQDAIEGVVGTFASASFRAHVILISHIDIRTQPDGTIQGFASSIGGALGPKLPRYFNTLLLCETSGVGEKVKRRLRTLPTSTVGAVKVPAPSKVAPDYPIESGLAALFEQLQS